MERRSYISCIKINGVPILPPLMTKEIADEMSYYKQLAIAVEKRLGELYAAKQVHDNTEIFKEELKIQSHNFNENKNYLIDDNITDNDISSTVTTIIHIPENGNSDVTDSDVPIRKRSCELEENLLSNSDEENKLELETDLASSTASRSQSLSNSTDLNHSSGDTLSMHSNTVENLPDCKPQVPKTLNVVPLCLNNPLQKGDEIQLQEESENSHTMPTLVRQGSYILDSPSPMLLAHMQSELRNPTEIPTNDYIPTNTAIATRRREWNIAEAKIQWEQCSEDMLVTECKEASNNGIQYDLCKSEPCHHHGARTKSATPFSTHPTAKSVDCIQAMLIKENIAKSSCGKHTPLSSIHTSERLPKSRTHENCSVFSIDQKLGGSLGNLNKVDTDFHRTIGVKNHQHNGVLKNGLNGGGSENMEIPQQVKPKSSITTEKLLLVYKEIQKMHQKQMSELVNRQQREQTLLQKEFEKQQLLLLNEIKKSFPKLPIPSLTEQLPPIIPRESTSSSNNSFENSCSDNHLYETTNVMYDENVENRTIPSGANRISSSVCPLDYIYPASPPEAEESDMATHNQCTQTSSINDSIESKNYLNMNLRKDSGNESEMNCDRKRLSVSRELFPLDSKTIHVPILGSGVYNEKHIHAASVINAYARGYLVRRLMQTARVIALKNTYKEALHCMLKLHVDAPLNRSEYHFLHRLQLQCDAASMNIVELFAQSPEKRMKIIAQDREIKRSRAERPMSARSYSFATQRTLARKKLKEMGDYRPPTLSRPCSSRSRCQTWTSDIKEKLISPSILHQTIKRSTSAGTVRKPWR